MKALALRLIPVFFMTALAGLAACSSDPGAGVAGCGDGQPALDCKRGEHEQDKVCVPNSAPQPAASVDPSIPTYGSH